MLDIDELDSVKDLMMGEAGRLVKMLRGFSSFREMFEYAESLINGG